MKKMLEIYFLDFEISVRTIFMRNRLLHFHTF